VDDVAYLDGLIREISGVYNVDSRRVYLVGHSNGGFMAYRMACDRAQEIAAIVSLAGATWENPAKCAPDRAVSGLQIHADRDQEVLDGGGRSSDQGIEGYPGAMGSIERWASYNRCRPAIPSAGKPLDLDALDGAETAVTRIGGCPSGISVELWTIQGG